MSDMLRWLVIGWIAGAGYVAGVIVVCATAIVALFRPRPRLMLPRFVALVALPLLALSAVPLPWWLYLTYAAATLLWSEAERRISSAQRLLIVPRLIVAISSMALLGWFLVLQILPRVPLLSETPIFALSTALKAPQESQEAWPRDLADLLDRSIDARPLRLERRDSGITSALARPGIVVIEIGPHDLLRRLTASEMRDGLELLLGSLSRQKHSAVMLEMPLGPLENRYGEIQRDLARRHNVALVPRWVLARAWVDSAAGPARRRAAQRFIAQRLYGVLRPVEKP